MGEHRYAEHYEVLFATLRRRKVVLLEIGVLGGASLRMWRSYFPRGRIVGVDILDMSAHDEARIKTFQGSQNDDAFLEKVIGEIGRPDIIIDDGSHEFTDVMASYRVLFPRLKPGGYYVIEDTFFSNAPEDGGADPDTDIPQTTVGHFARMVYGLNHRERVDSRRTSDYGVSIVAICFYNNLIIIKKGDDTPRPDVKVILDENKSRVFEEEAHLGR